MGRTALNLAGQRFGRLTVIEMADRNVTASGRTYAMCRCRCDCGKHVRTAASALNTGKVRSCGCLQREVVSTRNTRHGHGGRGRKTREYHVWINMKSRCYNFSATRFSLYGGRGIVVCDQWRDDFDTFLRDMGPCPPKHELDRIDADGPYAPDNCRWATRTQQNNNTRRNHLVTYQGESLTIGEVARRSGVPYKSLEAGIRQGKSAEDVIAGYAPRPYRRKR